MRITANWHDPRLIARILAVIGTFWALFSVPVIVAMFTVKLSEWESAWRGFVYIICGYLVYFGWVGRSIRTLPKWLAVVLWLGAFVVNLFPVVGMGLPTHWDSWDIWLTDCWWLFAAAASLLALVFEFVPRKETRDA